MKYFETDGRLPDLSPLVRNLESDSQFVRDKSASMLSLFLSIHAQKELETLDAYLTWVCEQLRHHKTNTEHSSFRAAVFSLTVVLSNPVARVSFQKHGGVKLIQAYLSNSASQDVQLVYEVTLCIWLLSLSQECVGDFGFQCVTDLSQLVSDNKKDKIVRVALAALKVIVSSQPEREKEIAEWISASDLVRTLEQMHTSRITDPDMLGDVEILRHVVLTNFRELSNFELYRQEVCSGKLKWGMTHLERFWKENSRAMEKDDFAVIRILVDLIDINKPVDLDGTPNIADNTTLAIACSDLGFFCQFYPNGKQILSSVGAKLRAMALLEHRDRDVQRAALLCVSKMLVNNWEYIGGNSNA